MDSSSSDKWLDRIDRLTEKVGRSASWLIVAVIAVAVLDVVMRYVFSAPTVWAYELNYMLGGTFALLGISYAQKHKRHMRMDLIYAKLSARKQLFIDIFSMIVFFLPMYLLLLYLAVPQTIDSLLENERSAVGIWMPPLFPFRLLITFAIVMFLIQGCADLARLLLQARRQRNG